VAKVPLAEADALEHASAEPLVVRADRRNIAGGYDAIRFRSAPRPARRAARVAALLDVMSRFPT
jgi:hypothetical protein